MYDVFTSATGTLQPKFKTIPEAVKYAETLGIDAQIFKVGDTSYTVVKYVFSNPKLWVKTSKGAMKKLSTPNCNLDWLTIRKDVA
jgi:hypothetical protein